MREVQIADARYGVTNARSVIVSFQATGVAQQDAEIQLGSDVNVISLLGTAWLTPATSGTPDVNAKLIGATSQTGRDLGASVLLSSGTGAGQLDFTSGVVKANATQIAGDAQTATNLKNIYGNCVATGTVNTVASNSDFTLTSSDLSSTDSVYVDMMLIFYGGNNQRVPRIIGAYTGATKRVQFGGSGFRGAFPLTVQAGDSFMLFSGSP